VEAAVGPTGAITLTPARRFDRKAFVARARRRLERMPMTRATVEAMRGKDRY
jgi:hypothetical protein